MGSPHSPGQYSSSDEPDITQPPDHCFVCADEKASSELAATPCNHGYCGECLSALFKKSLADETLFPPRWFNRPIPFAEVEKFLAADVVDAFKKMQVELNAENRTFCSYKECENLTLRDESEDGLEICPRCCRATCLVCKNAHPGYIQCPLLVFADEQGWKQCYSCRRVLELSVGCNHMTCLCGAQFCYACGGRWKTCTCPLWVEARLYDGAANNVPEEDDEEIEEPEQEQEPEQDEEVDEEQDEEQEQGDEPC